MSDIQTREDILLIMNKFYEKLLSDSRINYFFNKYTNVDQHLDEHLELLCTFWEQALFLKGGYSNNMFTIHNDIHQKHKFTNEHYSIWLDYLYDSVDTFFEGKYADQMKHQATNMATIMKIKLI